MQLKSVITRRTVHDRILFPLLTLMAERYWYLRAKSKEDLKTLRDDQRWLLTRVDYKSEAEATSARWRLENVLGIDLEVDSAMSEIA